MRKIFEGKYLDIFRATHFGIMPMTKKKLIQLCNQKKYRIQDYDFNEYTGLIRNACMSPHCAYYMKKFST